MDVFVLDELLRRTALIDQYESLIWTERYSAWGDFELVIRSDRGTRTLLPVGAHLAILQSSRVMTVESVEDKVTEEGIAVLIVSGRSIEADLENRAAIPALLDLTKSSKWVMTATPGAIARNIFQAICVNGAVSLDDVIPFYKPGTIFTPGTIAEPTDSVTIELELDNVYNTIKKICDMYNLGFRLVRNQDLSELYFDVYTGDDRTTLQTNFPAVVFSPSLENLADIATFTSNASYKNVAYVLGKHDTATVLAEGLEPNQVLGFDRRVLLVKADDIELNDDYLTDDEIIRKTLDFREMLMQRREDEITAAVHAYRLTLSGTEEEKDVLANDYRIKLGSGSFPEINDSAIRYRVALVVERDALAAAAWQAYWDALNQRGREELAKHRPIIAFDGEVSQLSNYVYDLDYHLGDLVETRNAEGTGNNMRVTEQIFISDAEGVRSYPTLTIDLLITAGSWYSSYGNQVWDDANEMWHDI